MLSERQAKDLTRRRLYADAVNKARYEYRKLRGLCVKCGQENDRFPLHVSCSVCLGATQAPQCVTPGCFRIGKFPTGKGPVCGYHKPGLHMTPEIRALGVQAKLRQSLTGEPFTEVDLRLLAMLANQYEVKRAAGELGYTDNAVYKRLQLLYRHAGVANLGQLLVYALRERLIQ